jgi:intein/homing endonuclease
MKYTKEITDKLIADYNSGIPVSELAEALEVPERSIIAKLSNLGVYKKKVYLNKNGEPPIKKDVYIDKIAELLDTNIELLESLEKVNKRVLILITEALEDGKSRS